MANLANYTEQQLEPSLEAWKNAPEPKTPSPIDTAKTVVGDIGKGVSSVWGAGINMIKSFGQGIENLGKDVGEGAANLILSPIANKEMSDYNKATQSWLNQVSQQKNPALRKKIISQMPTKPGGMLMNLYNANVKAMGNNADINATQANIERWNHGDTAPKNYIQAFFAAAPSGFNDANSLSMVLDFGVSAATEIAKSVATKATIDLLSKSAGSVLSDTIQKASQDAIDTIAKNTAEQSAKFAAESITGISGSDATNAIISHIIDNSTEASSEARNAIEEAATQASSGLKKIAASSALKSWAVETLKTSSAMTTMQAVSNLGSQIYGSPKEREDYYKSIGLSFLSNVGMSAVIGGGISALGYGAGLALGSSKMATQWFINKFGPDGPDGPNGPNKPFVDDFNNTLTDINTKKMQIYNSDLSNSIDAHNKYLEDNTVIANKQSLSNKLAKIKDSLIGLAKKAKSYVSHDAAFSDFKENYNVKIRNLATGRFDLNEVGSMTKTGDVYAIALIDGDAETSYHEIGHVIEDIANKNGVPTDYYSSELDELENSPIATDNTDSEKFARIISLIYGPDAINQRKRFPLITSIAESIYGNIDEGAAKEAAQLMVKKSISDDPETYGKIGSYIRALTASWGQDSKGNSSAYHSFSPEDEINLWLELAKSVNGKSPEEAKTIISNILNKTDDIYSIKSQLEKDNPQRFNNAAAMEPNIGSKGANGKIVTIDDVKNYWEKIKGAEDSLKETPEAMTAKNQKLLKMTNEERKQTLAQQLYKTGQFSDAASAKQVVDAMTDENVRKALGVIELPKAAADAPDLKTNQDTTKNNTFPKPRTTNISDNNTTGAPQNNTTNTTQNNSSNINQPYERPSEYQSAPTNSKTQAPKSTDDIVNETTASIKEVSDKLRKSGGRMTQQAREELASKIAVSLDDLTNMKAGTVLNAEQTTAANHRIIDEMNAYKDMLQTNKRNPDAVTSEALSIYRQKLEQAVANVNDAKSEAARSLGINDEIDVNQLHRVLNIMDNPESFGLSEEETNNITAEIQKKGIGSVYASLIKAMEAVHGAIVVDNPSSLGFYAGSNTQNGLGRAISFIVRDPKHIFSTLGDLWNGYKTGFSKNAFQESLHEADATTGSLVANELKSDPNYKSFDEEYNKQVNNGTLKTQIDKDTYWLDKYQEVKGEGFTSTKAQKPFTTAGLIYSKLKSTLTSDGLKTLDKAATEMKKSGIISSQAEEDSFWANNYKKITGKDFVDTKVNKFYRQLFTAVNVVDKTTGSGGANVGYGARLRNMIGDLKKSITDKNELDNYTKDYNSKVKSGELKTIEDKVNYWNDASNKSNKTDNTINFGDIKKYEQDVTTFRKGIAKGTVTDHVTSWISHLTKDYPALKFIGFYVQRSANVLDTLSDYTPVLGIAKYVLEKSKLDATQSEEKQGRLIITSVLGLSALGAAVSGQGEFITGAGPANAAEKKKWLKTHQPYTITIGNQTYNYKTLLGEETAAILSWAGTYSDNKFYGSKKDKTSVSQNLIDSAFSSYNDTAVSPSVLGRTFYLGAALQGTTDRTKWVQSQLLYISGASTLKYTVKDATDLYNFLHQS